MGESDTVSNLSDGMRQYIERLERENERLRTALEEAAAGFQETHDTYCEAAPDTAIREPGGGVSFAHTSLGATTQHSRHCMIVWADSAREALAALAPQPAPTDGAG